MWVRVNIIAGINLVAFFLFALSSMVLVW
jgi:hypothetical protein